MMPKAGSNTRGPVRPVGMTRRAYIRSTVIKTTDACAYWLLHRRLFTLANLVHKLARRMTHRRSCRH
jgi:hypothetical protein